MRATPIADTEEILINLVHDLRQPLANMEASAYVLRKWLPELPPQAAEHIRTLERQVAEAVSLLSEASADVRRVRAQRVSESREFTKAASAAVT